MIAAMKHTDLQEYGFDAVLKPFMEDMNMLSQVPYGANFNGENIDGFNQLLVIH